MPRIWKISAGTKSMFWEEFIENNLIAFGAWDEGDLSKYTDVKVLRDRMQGYSKRRFGHGTTSHNEAWNFRELKISDVILLYGNKAIIAIGVVTGPYKFDPNNFYTHDNGGTEKYFHIRPVEWIKVFEPPVKELSNRLITKLSKPSDTLHEIKDPKCIQEALKILAHRY